MTDKRSLEPPDPAWGIEGGERRCAECGDRIERGTWCAPCAAVLAGEVPGQ